MSLAGNLEDMPLQDILQIVHHSKKSGTLHLKAPTADGTVVFLDGSIIQAFSSSERLDLGEVLIEQGCIDPDELQGALQSQDESDGGHRLGSILVEKGLVQFADIENAVKAQIHAAIEELVRWNSGSFNLDLEGVPRYDSISLAMDDLVHPEGLDTQHVLIEALRRWDQDGQDQPVATSPPGAEAAEPAPPPPTPPDDVDGLNTARLSSPVIVLSTDPAADPALAKLRQLGYTAELVESADDSVVALRLYGTGNMFPMVIVDPRGLETEAIEALVGRLRRHAPEAPLLAWGRDLSPEVRICLYRTGFRCILPAPAPEQDPSDHHEELLAAVEALLRRPPPSEEQTPEVREFLEQMRQLQSKRETANMTLTFLQIVARTFERAVFFYLSSGRLVPLGAFGTTQDGQNIASLVHELVLEPGPDSRFEAATRSRDIELVKPSSQELHPDLIARISPPRDDRAALLPLVHRERVVAILYGDQGQSGRPLGDMEPLRPLLDQAAASLDGIMAGP